MSIIIGILTSTEKLIIASDKRVIIHHKNIVDDNYQKVFKLRNNLYLGITGKAEYGIIIKNRIIEFQKEKTISEIIEFTNLIYKQNHLKSTIMITGRFENKKLFIWSKNTDGELTFAESEKGLIKYSINTTDNIDLITRMFKHEIENTKSNYDLTIKRTIEFASTIDKTISKNYDLILL